MDYFDKIWMKNNKRKSVNSNSYSNKTLCCAGCFNTICLDAQSINFFNNTFKSNELINSYVDFLEILNKEEMINLMEMSFKSEKKSKKFSKNQLKELGIEEFSNEKLQYVCIKCKNCLNVIGVFNSQDDKYILFNCI